MPADGPPALPIPVAHSAPTAYTDTGRRLGRALLGYVAGVVGVITLEPFRFAWPRAFAPMLTDDAFGMAANVALFVPLGFLFAFTRAATASHAGDRVRPAWRDALLLGALASAIVEAVQTFEPGRYSSPIDVATNATGALLGAALHARLARRLAADTPLLGRLALELPVMGLLYLAVPLATLAATTAGDAGARGAAAWWTAALPAALAPALAWLAEPRGLALVALGGFAGALLGTVQRRQLGPTGAARRGTTALLAGGWTLVAAAPALATARPALAAAVLVAIGVAWGIGRRAPTEGDDARERRFEQEALLRAAPFLLAYLVLLPLGDGGPPPESGEPARLLILRRLEWLVALTAFGYLLAEAGGRREARYRHAAAWVGSVAGVLGLALAALAARTGADAASGARLAALALAGAYGGWLYHLQRAHVRALVEARSVARGTAMPTPADGARAAEASGLAVGRR